MNQSFYIGAVGAQQQLQRLNIHGDNISNVNTNGFKANRAHFAALLYQDHRGVEEELPMGVGTSLLMTSTDFSQGGPADTGRTLDYYIDGAGFFGVVDLITGEVTFTRNGAFYLSELVRETGEMTGGAAGTIVSAGKHGIDVVCGDGRLLRILELQAQGGKRMTAAAYLLGHPIQC